MLTITFLFLGVNKGFQRLVRVLGFTSKDFRVLLGSYGLQVMVFMVYLWF